MTELALKAVHEEVVSLVQRSVEEFEGGEAQAGISLLLEAQFLLGEVIQERLNNMEITPSLSPLMDEWVDDGESAEDNPSSEPQKNRHVTLNDALSE